MAHKNALHDLDDYDIRDIVMIDPLKPFAWDECVVNNIVLDMIDKNIPHDKIDLTEGFSTYAYPSL